MCVLRMMTDLEHHACLQDMHAERCLTDMKPKLHLKMKLVADQSDRVQQLVELGIVGPNFIVAELM